jgi:hypothetical protein
LAGIRTAQLAAALVAVVVAAVLVSRVRGRLPLQFLLY